MGNAVETRRKRVSITESGSVCIIVLRIFVKGIRFYIVVVSISDGNLINWHAPSIFIGI